MKPDSREDIGFDKSDLTDEHSMKSHCGEVDQDCADALSGRAVCRLYWQRLHWEDRARGGRAAGGNDRRCAKPVQKRALAMRRSPE